MTPLEIIKEAYDKAGIHYVVRKTESGYFYLKTCANHNKHEYELMGFQSFLYQGHGNFIEFYPDGSIASY